MEAPDTVWANSSPSRLAHEYDGDEGRGERKGNGEEGAREDADDDEEDDEAQQFQVPPEHDYTSEQYDELETRAGAVDFYEICKRLERCKASQKHDRLGKLFDDIIRSKIGTNPPQSLFPIIRLLCPAEDHRNGKFRLKGTTICDIYIKNLGLPEAEAARLKEYRDPKKNPTKASVDLGETLKDIIKERLGDKPSGMTVKQVNELILDKLINSNEETKMSIEQQTQFFRANVVEKMSWLEQVWLVRIIICESKRCGITSDAAIKFLGEGAPSYFNQCKYLRKVCADMALKLRSSVGMVLGMPLDPMLANKATSIQHAEEFMKHKPFLMERKLDGFRLVVHKMGGGRYYFSTRKTVMGSGPALSRDKKRQDQFNSLEPYLEKNILVEKCIIDGELMGWDPRQKAFVKFEKICGVHLRQDGGEDSEHFMYIAFDLIYLDGEGAAEAFAKAGVKPCKPHEVKDKPLEDRLKLLRAVVTVEEKHVEFVESKEVRSLDRTVREEAIKGFYEEALENNWEGLIIKNMTTPYVAKNREHWCKIKPDYVNDTEPMDVIILGGYFREGSLWTGVISRFLVGVAVPDTGSFEEEQPPGGAGLPRTYMPFAKVASGLNSAQREELNRKLEKHWFDAPAQGPMPEFLSRWMPSKDDRPARLIRPEHSVLLEVKAGELQDSKSFKLGWTMRFPRILRVRYDKPLKDALDMPGFHIIRDNFRRSKGTTKGMRDARRGSGRGEGGPRKKQGFKMADGFATRVTAEEVKSEIFEGVRICAVPFKNYESDLKCATKHLPDCAKLGAPSRVQVDHNQVLNLAYAHGAEVLYRVPAPPPDEERQTGRKRKRSEETLTYILAPAPRCQAVLNFIKSHEKQGGLPYDVVSLDWLLECVEAQRCLRPRANQLYAMTPETEQRLRNSYDKFKDSYEEPVAVDGLRKLLQDVERPGDDYDHEGGERRGWRHLASKHFFSGDNEERSLLDGRANLFYRAGFVFYVDCFETLGPPCPKRQPLVTSSLTVLRARLRLRGATVADELGSAVTVIVVDPRDQARFEDIYNMEKRLRWDTWHSTRQWVVVDRRWIDRCLQEGEMATPDEDLIVHLPTLLKAQAAKEKSPVDGDEA